MLVFFVGEQFVPQQKMGGIFVGWQGLYPVEFCWLVGLVFGIFTTIHPEIWVTHVHPLLKMMVGDDENLVTFPWIFSKTCSFGVDEK